MSLKTVGVRNWRKYIYQPNIGGSSLVKNKINRFRTKRMMSTYPRHEWNLHGQMRERQTELKETQIKTNVTFDPSGV